MQPAIPRLADVLERFVASPEETLLRAWLQPLEEAARAFEQVPAREEAEAAITALLKEVPLDG